MDLDHIPRYKEISVFLVLVVGVLLRYPFIPHELEGDTFMVHAMVNTIVKEGSIPWMVNPLSALGLYPGTYQTGSSVFLAIFIQLCDIDTEHAILYACFAFSILGTLAAYFMANRLTNNFSISILTAFLFTISPFFVQFTFWTYTTRGLFLAMVPLIFGTLFWLLIKFNEKKQNLDLLKILMVFLFLLAVIATIHKLFIFLLYIIIIGLMIVVCESYLYKKISYYRRLKDNTYLFLAFILCLAILLFHFSFTNIPFFHAIWIEYQTSTIFTGESYPILIINFLINYSRKLSLVFYLGFIGFFVFILYYKKHPSFIFFISLILLLLPFLPMGEYTPLMIIPLFSFLSSIFLVKIAEYSNSKYYLSKMYVVPLKSDWMNGIVSRVLLIVDRVVKNKFIFLFTLFLIILITLTAVNTIYVLKIFGERGTYMTEESYSTGLALKQSGAEMFSGGPAYEIYAISGVPYNLARMPYYNYLYATMFGLFEFDTIEAKYTLFDAHTASAASMISFEDYPEIPPQNTDEELIVPSADQNYFGNIWYDNDIYKISKLNQLGY